MTASAFFLMRWTRHLEFRAELVAYEFARGVVRKLDAKGVGDPLLDRTEGGKALRLGQGML